MFDESYNSFMTQISRSQELQCLEEAMARMDDADPNEIDSGEYQAMLARIVELRALLDKTRIEADVARRRAAKDGRDAV